MPAGLPGDSATNNAGNPTLGQFVVFDPLSGPKGSPFDTDNTGNASTGALSTCIGFGANDVIGFLGVASTTAPAAIFAAGFNDNNTPGQKNATYSAGGPPPVVATTAVDSTFMYLGGGRSVTASGVNPAGVAGVNPYTAGVALCGAGNGRSRDGGAGPIFTGFPMKMATATAGVANGAAVETGFTNRSGVSLVTAQSVYGSNTTQLAAAS